MLFLLTPEIFKAQWLSTPANLTSGEECDVYTFVYGTVYIPTMAIELPGCEGTGPWTRKMEIKFVNYLQVLVLCFQS